MKERKARISGQAITLVQCPYCHLWVDKQVVFYNVHGKGMESIMCKVCHERLTKCPVCQMNASQTPSVPEPREKNEVWHNPL